MTVYNLVERSGTILSFERVTFPDGRMTVTSGRRSTVTTCSLMCATTEFGVHSIEFGDAAIVAEAAPFFDGLWHYANDHIGLPLPSSWYLDSLGIHFPAYEGTLNQYGDFQFVPYWSTPASEDSGDAGKVAIQTNKPQSAGRFRSSIKSILAQVAAPSSSSRLWTFSPRPGCCDAGQNTAVHPAPSP